MEQKATQLSEQLLDYGVEIVRLTTKLEKSAAGRLIANQLIRRGTSTGANYEEACGAQSRADFIHKLQIVLKEIRESLYWLKLAQKSSVLKVLNDPSINKIIDETKQLSNIIAKSIITAKKVK
jgi:four helix bundle protein